MLAGLRVVQVEFVLLSLRVGCRVVGILIRAVVAPIFPTESPISLLRFSFVCIPSHNRDLIK